MFKKGYYGNEDLGLAWDGIKLSQTGPFYTTNIVKIEKISLKFFFKNFQYCGLFQASILTEYYCIPQMRTTIIYAQLTEFTFEEGFKKCTASLQLIFIFGFKVNKSLKAFGQALLWYLNMILKILEMLISYIFDEPISLKRHLECVS